MRTPAKTKPGSKPLYFRARELVSGQTAYDVIRWQYESATLKLADGTERSAGKTKAIVVGALNPSDGPVLNEKLRLRLSEAEAAEAQAFWSAHLDRAEADRHERVLRDSPLTLGGSVKNAIEAIEAGVLTDEQKLSLLALADTLTKAAKKACKGIKPPTPGKAAKMTDPAQPELLAAAKA
jgi:hypothetical protein